MRWCGRWSRRRRGNWRRRNDHGGNPATVARTFDAENHTLTTSESAPGQNGGEITQSSTVSWGPNGHPILVGSNYNAQVTQSDTLHWNGDTLLFTTTPQGQLDDIKIGSAADILPLDPAYNGLTFYDRDPSGGAMGCHNATGATFIGVADAYARAMHAKNLSGTIGISPCTTDTHYAVVTGAASMPTSVIWWTSSVTYSLGQGTLQVSGPQIGQGGVLGMPRTDGLADGTDAIQGVRTYDSNAGTWTTPDAYAGNVDDPASQKSYMWNKNDPESYSDPTGYSVAAVLEKMFAEGATEGASISEKALLGPIIGSALVVASALKPIPAGETQVQESMHVAAAGENGDRENGTNPKQDRRASKGEIAAIERETGESIEETKTGGSHAGGVDVWVDRTGETYAKARGSSGAGEPLGINVKNLPPPKKQ